MSVNIYSPSACEAQFDGLSQQVAEERQSVVQLHLFVVESQAEGHWAGHIPAKTEAHDPPQGKTQTDAVVPEVVKGEKYTPRRATTWKQVGNASKKKKSLRIMSHANTELLIRKCMKAK